MPSCAAAISSARTSRSSGLRIIGHPRRAIRAIIRMASQGGGFGRQRARDQSGRAIEREHSLSALDGLAVRHQARIAGSARKATDIDLSLSARSRSHGQAECYRRPGRAPTLSHHAGSGTFKVTTDLTPSYACGASKPISPALIQSASVASVGLRSLSSHRITLFQPLQVTSRLVLRRIESDIV